VQKTYLNGRRYGSVSYSRVGGSTLFKLTNLKLSDARIRSGSQQVCYDLLQSKCPTLNDFCAGGSCTDAVFSMDKQCCPVSQTPFPQ
jgi:hypothetical protein